MSFNSLYVLSTIPTALVRKIMYFIGSGTETAIIIKKKINYRSRLERTSRWVETNTFWSIGRSSVESTIFSARNPLIYQLSIWCEFRIIMLRILGQASSLSMRNIVERWANIFKTQHRAIFIFNHD